MQWFAAAYLLGETGHAGWEQVSRQDVQQWMVRLLGRYTSAYASNQYRALQQFFRWLVAAEDEIPDPMAGMHPPHIAGKLVPVFAGEELSRLERACAGRTFAQRRDAAVTAVFRATGIRLAELAGIRYDPAGMHRGDVDLWRREITVRGKGGKPRVVKISYDTARSLDRYIRVRARHAQAYRPQLWLGVKQPQADDRQRDLPDDRPPRPPVWRGGVPAPVQASLQPHVAEPRRRGRGPEGAERLTSPQMLRLYGASASAARARRTYDGIMQDIP